MTHVFAFLLGAALVGFLNNRGLNKSHAQLIEAVSTAAAQATNLRLELQAFWREHSAQRDVENALRGILARKERELDEVRRIMSL